MNDDLLVKCLLGEATEPEVQAVAAWRQSSVTNNRYYEQFKLIWEQSQHLASNSIINTDAAWGRFQQRVAQSESAQGPSRLIPINPKHWLRLAAVLIVMLGAGLTFYLTNRTPPMVARNSGDAVLIDTLPDGSVITLNSHSTLSYPARFTEHTRPVKLQGEAFFMIMPDKSKPFIINANGVDVKVVGTSFNVKTSPEATEVVVETGIVEVAKQEHKVKLAPHERIFVRKDDLKPVKEKVTDELYNYYRTRKFECINTPLPRLVEVLNEAYHAQIVIDDSRLNHILVNTTFQDDSLQEIFDVISSTYNVSVEKEGERYLMRSRN